MCLRKAKLQNCWPWHKWNEYTTTSRRRDIHYVCINTKQVTLTPVHFALPPVQCVNSSAHYCTVQYNTVQYSTVQYSTVQYSTVQFSTVQCSTLDLEECPPWELCNNSSQGPSSATFPVERDIFTRYRGQLYIS